MGGPVSSYVVTLTPVASSDASVTTTCPTINCLVTGLTPGAAYAATAVAIQGGVASAASVPLLVTPPAATAAALNGAEPTSPTTLAVSVDPPAGITFTSVS